MEGMRTMMLRPATINNLLSFPLTIHTPQNIVKLLHTIFFQGPLERHLSVPDPKLLLHLLEEVRCMEP